MRFCPLLFCLSLATCNAALQAEVRLPHIFSDHAVLQRGGPIHVWGWATPGAHLNAKFHAQNIATEADRLGKWSLWLAPESAGGPYELAIDGDGTEKKIVDLLVGDVWFASGQSNMEIPLNGFTGSAPIKDGPREIAAANNPKLRLLLAEHKTSDFPLNDNSATWTTCTPATAANFSAVAYFFGREVAAKENVPIGLIDSTWGGTPADAWTSMDTLGTHAELLPAFASRARFADPLADDADMQAAETREQAEAKSAGKPMPSFQWHPYETSWAPAALYNGMIAPFAPYSVEGFLWYQGETNSSHDRAPYYGALMTALIGDWRQHFAQGNLPFLFVQISSFLSPGEDWGMVRDQQRRTLSVADTAMAVSLDVGLADNVHPPDKQTVAARLALAARALAYHENVEYASPTLREVSSELQADGSTSLRVWFRHGAGLTARGRPVAGFEIAGADRHFIPAQARLEGETALVSSPAMKRPVFVRYGWMSVVVDSLYNAAGLPASTFTSEPDPGH